MRKDCVYEGKCYSHGAALAVSGEDMVCNDGNWEKELAKPGLTIAPGENLSEL